MTCALAYAIKDHAVQLALAVRDDPPSLVNISLRQATTEKQHTYVDPSEGLRARVPGV